jgi:hypothetical protein
MSSASDRLARSRMAIIEHVYRKDARKDGFAKAAHHVQRDAEEWEADEIATAGNGLLARVKRAVKDFWRHHPARLGLEVATPLLARYAAKNPAAYVSIAALSGAVFVAARPWRLLSVTGVLVALAKSPQLAGAVMAAMSGGDWDEET